MRKMAYLVFEGLMVLSLMGLLAAFHQGSYFGTLLLKSLTSLLFVLAGGCGYLMHKEKRTFSRPVFLALLCAMAGDVLLAIDRTQGLFFVLGVASFAAAHVLFSFSFCRICTTVKKDIAGSFVLFIGLVLLLTLGNFSFHGLFPVLLGYSAIISFMTVKALSVFRCRRELGKAAWLIMAGGMLFLTSDIVLLFWLFGVGMPEGVQWANWILYYLAQGCLSAALSAKQQVF